MKKTILLIFSWTLFLSGISQNTSSDDSIISKYNSNHNGFEFGYSNYYPNLKLLNNFFSENYGEKFPTFLQTASIGLQADATITNDKTGRALRNEVNYCFSFIIGNLRYDSIYALDLSGWFFCFNFLSKDVLWKKEKFDWNLSSGIAFGRLKIHETQKSSTTIHHKYSNPLLGINLKSNIKYFLLRKLSVGLRSGYIVDLSNKTWISKDGGTNSFTKTDLSGFDIAAELGFYW